MALGANAIDTLANIKVHLRIQNTDTTYDNVLEPIIDGVSVEFNTYCRREIIARDRTDYYDGPGQVRLWLHHWPINSITSINEDSDREFGAGTLIDADDYYFSKEDGYVSYESGAWGSEPKSIKVVYNAGYEQADVPADLLLAFRDQVKERFRLWKTNDDGKASVTRESASVTFVDSVMLPKVETVLKHYRRWGHTGMATA